jgi:hypothetical protein
MFEKGRGDIPLLFLFKGGLDIMKDISDDILHTINDIRPSIFNRIIYKSQLIDDFLNSSYIEYLFNLSESLYVNSYKVDDMQQYYNIVKHFKQYYNIVKHFNSNNNAITLSFNFKDSNQILSHAEYIINILLKYYKEALLEIKQHLLKTFDEIEDIIFYVGNMYLLLSNILSQVFGIILKTSKEEGLFNIVIVSNSSFKDSADIEELLSEYNMDYSDNNVIIEVILKDKERRFFIGDKALRKLRKAENIFELSMFNNLKEFHSVLCNEFLTVLQQSFLDVIGQLVSDIDSTIKNINSISDEDKPLFVYETFADGDGYMVSISANKSIFDNINKQLMDEYNLPPFFNISTLGIEFVIKLDKRESKIGNISKKIKYEYPGTDMIRYLKSISYLSEYADDIIKTIYDVYQKLIKIEERINKYYEKILHYTHDLTYLDNMGNQYSNLIESRFDTFLSSIIDIKHCQMSFEDIMTTLTYKEYIPSNILKNIIIIGGKNE